MKEAIQKAIEGAKVCGYCEKPIFRISKWSKKQWENKKFCSADCQRKGRDASKSGGHNKGIRYVEDKKCDACSRVNRKVAWYPKFGMTLCQRHYWHIRLHSKILWGDNRPVKTPLERRLRNIAGMREWRTAVFERDDYTCQICGEKGGQLNADHIKPFKYFPDLRFEITNGRTLCVPCHRMTDTYGRRVDKLYGTIQK